MVSKMTKTYETSPQSTTLTQEAVTTQGDFLSSYDGTVVGNALAWSAEREGISPSHELLCSSSTISQEALSRIAKASRRERLKIYLSRHLTKDQRALADTDRHNEKLVPTDVIEGLDHYLVTKDGTPIIDPKVLDEEAA